MLRTILHPETPPELQLLTFEDLSQAFEMGEALSVGNTQIVKKCQLHGCEYILKNYQNSGLLSFIRLATRQSRAHLSFRFAKLLSEYKISCPRHLALITKLGLAKSTTFLLMEKSPGRPLFDYIQPSSTDKLNEQVITNIAKIITTIHHHGIAHGDMHTRNLIVAPDDNVSIIDLDSMRLSKRRRKKDLHRFTSAVKKGSRYSTAIISALDKADTNH